MAISDDFLRELNSRVRIEDVVSPYVNLRSRGRLMTGLCPFHSEKTGSFTVYTDSNSFYCFGCGAGGDIVSFVRQIENLDYVEAVRLLAEKAGMSMPNSGFDEGLHRRRTRILEANREAARFFNSELMSERGRKCLDYFYARGLTGATIKSFGLGFAPDSWDSLLRHMEKQGFSRTELLEANLARSGRENNSCFDNFRNRAMVPIIDLRGNVIAFGGRVLDDSKPKYVNTSDTPVYKKSSAVFALNFAKNCGSRTLVLVEGYMDVISLHQAGFTNTVACLGTALTSEQVSLVCRYADEVVLAYDMDEAGRKATEKAMEMFGKTGIRLRVLSYSGGKDLDEVVRKCGVEKVRNLLDGAANDTEYKLLQARSGIDVSTDDGKLNYLRSACSVLSKIESEIELDIYISRLSQELEVDKQALAAQVGRLRKKNEGKSKREGFEKLCRSTAGASDKINPERAGHLRAAVAEETLISLLVRNPDFYARLSDKVSEEDFITRFNARAFAAIWERLKNGTDAGLAAIAPGFTQEELGGISRIVNVGENRSNTVAECLDCIKVLREEKAKTRAVDPSQVSNNDFLDLFKNIKDKKQNG